MRILVLGAGPAGLLAAHAASYVDKADIVIVSNKVKSGLFGCQYLHGPIPGFDLETTTVDYRLEGTVEDYAAKAYQGQVSATGVSPATLMGPHPAWNMRQCYDQLWDRWEDSIVDAVVKPEQVTAMLGHYNADLVVSSIPAPVLCQRPGDHQFSSVESWALGDAPVLGQVVPVPCPPDTVLCTGDKDRGYHRVSNVFGYKTAEWPGHRRKPPIDGVVRFSKPLATNCECWPLNADFDNDKKLNGILRVGRYGTWRKGVLSHEAFSVTAMVLGLHFQKFAEEFPGWRP
jgi:hypothetical protein